MPDALWAYSLSSMLIIIWDYNISKKWITIVVSVFILFEWLQFINIIDGTSDVIDFIVYCISLIIALKTNIKINKT